MCTTNRVVRAILLDKILSLKNRWLDSRQFRYMNDKWIISGEKWSREKDKQCAMHSVNTECVSVWRVTCQKYGTSIRKKDWTGTSTYRRGSMGELILLHWYGIHSSWMVIGNKGCQRVKQCLFHSLPMFYFLESLFRCECHRFKTVGLGSKETISLQRGPFNVALLLVHSTSSYYATTQFPPMQRLSTLKVEKTHRSWMFSCSQRSRMIGILSGLGRVDCAPNVEVRAVLRVGWVGDRS